MPTGRPVPAVMKSSSNSKRGKSKTREEEPAVAAVRADGATPDSGLLSPGDVDESVGRSVLIPPPVILCLLKVQ